MLTTPEMKALQEELKSMMVLDTYVHTGRTPLVKVQRLISTWTSRSVLKGRFRSFIDENKLYIVRVE